MISVFIDQTMKIVKVVPIKPIEIDGQVVNENSFFDQFRGKSRYNLEIYEDNVYILFETELAYRTIESLQETFELIELINY